MSYTGFLRNSASEDRLEKLMLERIKPGTNKKWIDDRIWDMFGETWSIMFTDLSGFSRGVAEFGIIHFLQVIYEAQRILSPCIDEHDGILLKMDGDSMLVIFRNLQRAVSCAINMQETSSKYNEDKPDSEKILLCVGIGYGRVLRIGDNDVWGSEVNAASKLGEDTAKSKEILVTHSVQEALLGQYDFKKIDEIPPGSKAAYKLVY